MPGTSDTFTTSNRLDKQPHNGNFDLWDVYLNTNFDLIDALKDGNVQITMSSSQHTLTTASAATDEARMASVTLIGTSGGTGTITAPNVQKLTFVENLMTDGFPAKWTNGTGTAVTVNAGAAVVVQNDANGNMRILAGNQFSGRTLQNVGTGTASDDGVNVAQMAGYVSTASNAIPVGGTAGQVLAKNSGTNYDVVWGDVSGGTGAGAWLKQGYETVFIPAQSFTPLSTNGAVAATEQLSNGRMAAALSFDGTTTQFASFTIDSMPRSWNGTGVYCTPVVYTTGSSGSAKFELGFGAFQVGNGASMNGTYSTATDQRTHGTEGTAARINIKMTEAPVSITGTYTSGNSLSVRIYRNPATTNDNMAGKLYLAGVTMRYIVNAQDDT